MDHSVLLVFALAGLPALLGAGRRLLTTSYQSVEFAMFFFKKTPPPEPKIVHPFYPVEIEIVDFVANDKSVPQLLVPFLGGLVVILATAWLSASRFAPHLRALDKTILLWFILSRAAEAADGSRLIVDVSWHDTHLFRRLFCLQSYSHGSGTRLLRTTMERVCFVGLAIFDIRPSCSIHGDHHCSKTRIAVWW